MGPALHFGAVEHVYCPEHRRLEHVPGRQVLRPTSTVPDTEKVVDDARSDPREHSSCEVTLATCPALRTVTETQRAELAWPLLVAPATESRAATPGIELLAQAPKLSPPHA